MTNKKTFLEFLQSSSGENSSKRLAFLLTIIVSCYGVISQSESMIVAGKAEEAVKLWGYFFILIGFLGGFVTSEIIIKFLELKNGRRNDYSDDK